MTQVKRIYETAAAEPAGEEGYRVVLDGRPVRTPGGKPLTVPTAALAEALAAEWDAQEEEIQPHTMPLTQLACTALDQVADERAGMEEAVARFAGTDLLCYRADAGSSLAERQAEAWQPLLDWAAETFGAELAVTEGIMPVTQPEETVTALAEAAAAVEDMRFAALQCVTAAAGSLVLALALLHGARDAEQVIAAAELDEIWQEEFWGADPEQVARREGRARDIRAAARLLALLDR